MSSVIWIAFRSLSGVFTVKRTPDNPKNKNTRFSAGDLVFLIDNDALVALKWSYM